MLDPEARDTIQKARDQRQIHILVRFVPGAFEVPAKAPSGSETADDAWARIAAAVLDRVAEYEAHGLRLLKHVPRRPELILTGPAGGWRKFVADKRPLPGGRSAEFRVHHPDWRSGLGIPGIP
jgi:hypothetical protein